MDQITENQIANNGGEGLAQLANERQNDAREARTPLRLVKMKFDTNAKMVRTLTAAVSKGIDKLILTPRVDVAGCGYVWLGIRKGRIELDGKLLLNRQIGEYLLAYLQGTELPEITDFDSDREICCQSDWLEAIATKLEKLATTAEEEYTETEETGYLTQKYHLPNGKVIMPSEEIADVTALLA